MVRNNEHMFKKTNLSPLAIEVLTYLARSPRKQFYLREIATKVGGSVGGCHNVLKDLYRIGLIDKEKSGRNLYYSVQGENPAIPYFKIFINILDLTEVINKIADKCTKIILFGSCSTGEDTLESDIDILAITEEVEEIRHLLKDLSVKPRNLKPIILFPHEFMKLKSNDLAFYDEVSKGIVLTRGENE
jgi:predicted nucleotidyltransferase